MSINNQIIEENRALYDSVGSIWIRDVGRYNKFRDESKQLNTYGKAFTVQIGGDIARWSTDGMNRYHLGIMGGYGFNHNSTNSKIHNNINCVTIGDIKTKILDIYAVRAPETPFIIISAIIPISNIFSILAVLIKNKFCIFFT